MTLFYQHDQHLPHIDHQFLYTSTMVPWRIDLRIKLWNLGHYRLLISKTLIVHEWFIYFWRLPIFWGSIWLFLEQDQVVPLDQKWSQFCIPAGFFLTQTRSEMCSFSEKSEAEDFLQLATPKKNGSKSVIDYSNPQTNRENLPVTSLKNLRKVTWMFPKIWLPQVTMAFNMFQY